jgi:hypothetical protein
MRAEERSAAIRAGWAKKSPKERSEIARERWAAMTPERRSEIARKRRAAQLRTMTPEQRSAARRKVPREAISEGVRKWHASRSPEERRATMLKAWETRRARSLACRT